MKSSPFNRIEVSRSALLHNFDLLKDKSQLEIMPVVKSNAYGHGLDLVAEALKDRDFPYLAVNSLDEAMQVRQVSPQPLLIMGSLTKEELENVEDKDIAYLVQDKTVIEALSKKDFEVKVHLDIDTGMKRYGIDPDELGDYLDLIKISPNITLEGVASHLADGDGIDAEYTKYQIDLFDGLVDQVFESGFKPKLVHIANAPGFSKHASRTANAFRPGIAIYGVNPLSTDDPKHDVMDNLRPALKMVSHITKVRKLNPGDHVGYSKTFEADHNMTIGVIPLGYYEGLPRSLSNESSLKAGDKFLKITGRISMNHTMIDITGTDLEVGDEIVAISNNKLDSNSIEQMCKDFYFFTYGLLVKLGPDVQRTLVD